MSESIKPAVHFVGFRGEEYWSAVRIWGPPHFIHIVWDRRAQRDIAPSDIVIFAKGEFDQEVCPYNHSDMFHGPIHLFC